MTKIRFSHNYSKLKGIGETAKLIAVTPLLIDEQTPGELIRYDTRYVDGINSATDYDTLETCYYKLDKGKYVLLLFLSKNKLFTTIRPQIGYKGYNKLEYYSKHLYEDFEVVIPKEVL